MANETIGKLKNGCPFTGQPAEVRKDKNGKLYFYSRAGLIKPNLPEGQDWMLENSVMYAPNERETNHSGEPPAPKPARNVTGEGDPEPVTSQNEGHKPPKRRAWQTFFGEDDDGTNAA